MFYPSTAAFLLLSQCLLPRARMWTNGSKGPNMQSSEKCLVGCGPVRLCGCCPAPSPLHGHPCAVNSLHTECGSPAFCSQGTRPSAPLSSRTPTRPNHTCILKAQLKCNFLRQVFLTSGPSIVSLPTAYTSLRSLTTFHFALQLFASESRPPYQTVSTTMDCYCHYCMLIIPLESFLSLALYLALY